MTKKSLSRLQRDAEKKQLEHNTCWDDLNEIYQASVVGLASHLALAQEAGNTELLVEIADKATFIRNVNLLSADLVTLSSELAKLRELHGDKRGGSQDPDVVMYSIQVAEQYNLWKTKHETVVMPTVYHIVEQLQLAENRLRAKRAARDVAVVTDVQIKETSGDTMTLQVSNGTTTGEVTVSTAGAAA